MPNTPYKRLLLASGSVKQRLRDRVRVLLHALETVYARASAKKGNKALVVDRVLCPTEYDCSRDLDPED